MKLRNKKTGEIRNAEDVIIESLKKNGSTLNAIIIDEIREEWEDYEEPKEYWSYDTFENDVSFNSIANEDDRKADQEIGNYFETKEEAEKAVEKLKAWKRLKDKGFRFIDHIDRDSGQGMTRYEWDGYVNGEDLDLLFGGEQ